MRIIEKFFGWAGRRYVPIVIFVVAAAGMFLSQYFSGCFYRLYQINSYSGEALDNHTIYFWMQGIEAEHIDLSELQKGEIVQNATILAHAPSTGSEYCVLYTDGKKDIFGGKYFQGWDFTSWEVGCIAGANAAKKLDGEVAYLKSGRYPILAVQKESFLAGVNSAVFYTNSELDAVRAEEIFAVASSKKSEAGASYARLEKYMGSMGVVLQELTFSTVTLENFLHYNDGFLLAMGGYALFLFVIHLLLYWYWRQYKKTWCRVMYFFGVDKPELRVTLGFCLLLAGADWVGGIIYCVMAKHFWQYSVLIGTAVVFGIQIMAVLAGNLFYRMNRVISIFGGGVN